MRFIKQIETQTQALVMFATGMCQTELAWNEELWSVHYGEDGPGLTIVHHRAMFINEQRFSGEFQPWALYELYDEIWCK